MKKELIASANDIRTIININFKKSNNGLLATYRDNKRCRIYDYQRPTHPSIAQKIILNKTSK